MREREEQRTGEHSRSRDKKLVLRNYGFAELCLKRGADVCFPGCTAAARALKFSADLKAQPSV